MKKAYLFGICVVTIFVLNSAIGLAWAGYGDNKPITYVITGASAQGYFAAVVQAINALERDAYPGTQATFKPGSPAGSVLQVATGKADLAIPVNSTSIKYALAGKKPFPRSYKGDICFVNRIQDNLVMHVIALKSWADKYGIKSLEDIAKKKPPMRLTINNSANLQSTVAMPYALFHQYGFSIKDIKRWGGRLIIGNSGIGMAALRDGKVDVFINGRFAPDSKTRNIARHKKLVWLHSSKDKVTRAAQKWGNRMIMVPKDSYSFLKEDQPTIALWEAVYANPAANQEMIYKFVKALYNNQDRVHAVNPALRNFDGKMMVTKKTSVPYCSGAKRFYREKGLLASSH